jgi:maltokinase
VTGALEQFIAGARWFGGKGRDFAVTDVRRLGWLDPSATGGEHDPRVRIELVTVRYEEAGSGQPAEELYQVPLAYYTERQERLEHAFVGAGEDTAGSASNTASTAADTGSRAPSAFVYDALADRYAVAQWLRAFADARTDEATVFHRVPGHDLDLEAPGSLFTGEQSNSSVRFGEDSLMKVFRKVTPGRNPDIEIHHALTLAENEHVAALYGWLETRDEAGGDPGAEPLQLAMLQQFLRTGTDGWGLALASVRDLYAEADLHADEVGGDFAAETHRLGVATAQVHDALAEHFPVETWGADQLTVLSEAMQQRLRDAVGVVPELAPHAEALREAFVAVGQLREPVPAQRIHADFHLGQTLRTVRGWKLVDFEGEPAKPLSERVRPDSAWRDVAGMLRSFDYAAHAVEADVEEAGGQIAYRALEWVERNRAAFLAGYLETSKRTADGELSADQHALLRAYEVDKAVYETVYEARNRPDWLAIPLGAIERLTTTDHQEASR